MKIEGAPAMMKRTTGRLLIPHERARAGTVFCHALFPVHPVSRSSRIAVSILFATGSAGFLFSGWLVFKICRFIYTDAYYSDRQMHRPEATDTWWDLLHYAMGLTLWSIPALVLAIPGLLLAFVAIRRLGNPPVRLHPYASSEAADPALDHAPPGN